MPAHSIDTAALFVRVAFLLGALTDGLAVVPMLSPRVSARLFGADPSRTSRPEYRYSMRLGASLMAGWTVLLLWGVADPIARRDLLVITVLPVVVGIVFACVAAVRNGVLPRSRVTPLLIHLTVVSALYIAAYVTSAPFAR